MTLRTLDTITSNEDVSMVPTWLSIKIRASLNAQNFATTEMIASRSSMA